MRIWFNKTFSTISAVFRNLRLSQSTHNIRVICSHSHATASAFLSADEVFLEPEDLTGLAYVEWCIDFCHRHKIDLFWPGKEVVAISKEIDLFNSNGIKLMLAATHPVLKLLNNKADFYQDLSPDVALTMDFAIANNIDEFETALARLSAKHEKLCVKPAVSVFGLGFRVLDTERDSITQILKGTEYHVPLRELRQGMNNTPKFDTLLVMEHLGGSEWSVDCVGNRGELLCAVQRKKSQSPGHGQIIDNNTEIQRMVERLTCHYRLNGIYNIQFKEGKNGPRLLEINPRPSGGFGMSCLAGPNLAKLAIQVIKGEPLVKPPIRYGLKVNEINTPVILAHA